MANIEKLTLIEGVFCPDEAREILSNLILSKINFYKTKSWSSRERFGKDDANAGHRVPALQRELEKLQAILAEAKASNKKLVVSSKINMTLIDG